MNTDKLNAIEISTVIGCKLDCEYCPQQLLVGKYYEKSRQRKLSFQDFKTILSRIEPGGIISFCGFSEPFHNEACADMIVYAYEQGYSVCLLTTLVGMRREDYEKIKNVKFDSFVLHIPDEEKRSKFVITEEYLELVKLVNENIRITCYSCHGTVHSSMKGIIDEEKFAGISLTSRAGNLEGEQFEAVEKKGKIMCYHSAGIDMWMPLWMPVVCPDGTLVLCCQDYGMEHRLGNLIEQSWDEIREGEVYKKLIHAMEDDTVDVLCRKCEMARNIEQLPSMQLKKAIENKEPANDYPADIKEMIQRFAQAETVCVFGLGKLWREHFFREYWNEGLGVTIFSDNNAEYHNQMIKGIPCVSPDELINYNHLLVVLFVKKGEKIVEQLQKMGINNYIFIDEVFHKCNRMTNSSLCEKVKKKVK